MNKDVVRYFLNIERPMMNGKKQDKDLATGFSSEIFKNIDLDILLAKF